MKTYKHAHLMKQYAEDAMTTDKPWELWEVNDNGWIRLKQNPRWSLSHEYRRIDSDEIPKPLTVVPEIGNVYYSALLLGNEAYNGVHEWRGELSERWNFRTGFCFATAEDRDKFLEMIK